MKKNTKKKEKRGGKKYIYIFIIYKSLNFNMRTSVS